MFHMLTVVLIPGPRKLSDGVQNIAGLSGETDIWTIYQEVIMTRIATVMELLPTDHRKSRDGRNDSGHGASSRTHLRHVPENPVILPSSARIDYRFYSME